MAEKIGYPISLELGEFIHYCRNPPPAVMRHEYFRDQLFKIPVLYAVKNIKEGGQGAKYVPFVVGVADNRGTVKFHKVDLRNRDDAFLRARCAFTPLAGKSSEADGSGPKNAMFDKPKGQEADSGGKGPTLALLCSLAKEDYGDPADPDFNEKWQRYQEPFCELQRMYAMAQLNMPGFRYRAEALSAEDAERMVKDPTYLPPLIEALAVDKTIRWPGIEGIGRDPNGQVERQTSTFKFDCWKTEKTEECPARNWFIDKTKTKAFGVRNKFYPLIDVDDEEEAGGEGDKDADAQTQELSAAKAPKAKVKTSINPHKTIGKGSIVMPGVIKPDSIVLTQMRPSLRTMMGDNVRCTPGERGAREEEPQELKEESRDYFAKMYSSESRSSMAQGFRSAYVTDEEYAEVMRARESASGSASNAAALDRAEDDDGDRRKGKGRASLGKRVRDDDEGRGRGKKYQDDSDSDGSESERRPPKKRTAVEKGGRGNRKLPARDFDDDDEE